MPKELTYKGSFKNNKILILDAIPDDELQTARYLEEEIKDFIISQGEQSYCHREKLKDRGHFINFFKIILQECEADMLPLLHIEAHGDKSLGLQIGGDFIGWEELLDLCRPINSATKNNLGLILASCYGQETSKLINISKPCPFHFMIGPSDIVAAKEIRDRIPYFYKSVLENQNLNLALNYINPQFVLFYSSEFFVRSMAIFFSKNRSNKNRSAIAEEIVTKALEKNENSRNTRRLARKSAKHILKNPENFYMHYMKGFLHGQAPVTFKDLENFYMQFNPASEPRI